MRSEIIYGGVSTEPNDYVCQDGELAGALNVVGDEGGLTAMGAGSAKFTLAAGYEIWFVHKNLASGVGYTHYIGLHSWNESSTDYRSVAWIEVNETASPISVDYTDMPDGSGTLAEGEEKVAISAVGNVLILVTSVQKYYWLWKGSDYIYLGSDLPEIDITFTSMGWFNVDGSEVLYDGDAVKPADTGTLIMPARHLMGSMQSAALKIDDVFEDFPDADTEVAHVRDYNAADSNAKNYPEIFTNRCYGLLNGLLEEAKKQGRMVMPRLVRAAWRLYDGSYAKFTTPVLMFSFGTHNQTVLQGAKLTSGSSAGLEDSSIASTLYPYTIDYYLRGVTTPSTGVREKWGDIIKGITFFSSSGVYDYEQSGTISEIVRIATTSTIRPISYGSGGVVDVRYTHYYARLARPAIMSQVEQLRRGGPFYKIYDRELSDVSKKYALLYMECPVDNGEEPTKYWISGDTTLTIGLTYGSTSRNVVVAVKQGESINSVYDKVEEAVMTANLPLEVHKISQGKKRLGKKTFDTDVAIAFMSNNGSDVTLDSISLTDGMALLVAGLTCGGSPLPSDRLPIGALVEQQTAGDDYLGHVELLPKALTAYNNRLSMANLQSKFKNYQVTWNDTASDGAGHVITTAWSGYRVQKVWYYIKTDAGDVVVQNAGNNAYSALVHYLYYPDNRCYKAIVKYCKGVNTSNTSYYLSLPMKPSALLNGSVFIDKIPYIDVIQTLATSISETPPTVMTARNHFKDELDVYKITLNADPTADTSFVERMPSSILTTRVNNPFSWEANGMVSVGSSEVMGLMANTTALSQGQFGEHPMYAFTTEDGVWALSVGGDGSYKAVQPVSRDVCLSAESITQTDDAVLFAAERGIMMLSGSKATCISDSLNSKEVFNVVREVNNAIVNNIAGGTVLVGDIGGEAAIVVPFNEFLQGCRMVYDYVHQRVVVYNADKAYAYVFSVKGKKWTQIPSTIQYALNSYPDAIVVEGGEASAKSVKELSGDETGTLTGINGMVMTRPIKLGQGDVLKTIRSVIQRGDFGKDVTYGDHVKQILYGSRDLENWFVIGSSNDRYLRNIHGTAYKYFRLGLKMKLTEAETLVGCTVDWDAKQTNQSR